MADPRNAFTVDLEEWFHICASGLDALSPENWDRLPSRVDVTMRMPVFAMDGKTTQIREVFDGDAHRQFEAIWHYIQTLPGKDKDGGK